MRAQLTIVRKFMFFIVLFLSITNTDVDGQSSYNVLFLGNSYTGVNNLPQLVYDVALSAGDTLVFDSHTPGGYQLENHSIDATSQNKIMAGNWNYVVIQGQSQEPITASSQFFNGAGVLINLIKQYNPCAVPMPYMTWGRKNGDASNCQNFPIMCTYQGMDTTIRDRYLTLTDMLNGEVSPVSVVWRYIRQNYPNIELYQPDESHPSAAGSYAAACCFYATIFKKDPTLITFDFGLNASDAAVIRSAAKTQVFDVLPLYDFKKLPVSDFIYEVGPGINEIIFNSNNQGAQQNYIWDFGDGITDSISNPTHSYLTDGTYTVSLTTTNCDLQGLHTSFSDTIIQFCAHTPTIFTSNPWLCNMDTLWTQPADSYQWYYYDVPLPETNQFLHNYLNYGLSGFSVLSTLNGCSELSQNYNETVTWSGYYFDAVGNPCIDTTAFAVLHTNGSLPGSQNIFWYKNDTLLPLLTNEDTLLIFGSGKYECKVIDPNSNCPLDTTSYSIIYNCSVIGIYESDELLSWRIFPNPASESITIEFDKISANEQIEIYNTIGVLTKTILVSSSPMKIDVNDLRGGVYYFRLKGNNHLKYKLIKLL